jgi:hypothetical protein
MCELDKKTTLKFLGHVVSTCMVAADPDKLKALHEWPLPTSRAQLRAFLRLANYFVVLFLITALLLLL